MKPFKQEFLKTGSFMKQLSMLMSLVLIACSSSPDRGSASGAILAQSIGEFHRPESVAFSIDGKELRINLESFENTDLALIRIFDSPK